jgi:hypothetical protein
MLRVNLTVLPPTASPTDDRGEDWGEWDFTSLPQAGDHIEMDRNDRKETLQVRRVIHFAAQHPLPRSETPFRQRKQPAIRIIALRVDGSTQVK